MDNINERVAKALGWRVGKFKKDGKEYLAIKDPESESLMMESWGQLPNYSGSIEAAWEIVDELKELGFGLRYGSEWVVTNGCGMEYEEDITTADTAPMAICLAFLKLKEGERD